MRKEMKKKLLYFSKETLRPMIPVPVWFCTFLCILTAHAQQSDVPLFVGGYYESGGAEPLRSFGEYIPEDKSWFNMNGSSVLTSGVPYAITMVRPDQQELVVVGGSFQYLNNSESSLQYGNVAMYNTETSIWQKLGGGCNNVVSSLASIRLLSNTSQIITTIIVGGDFTQCYLDNAEKTAISFTDGIGFYDLSTNRWYKPSEGEIDVAVPVYDISVLSPSIYVAGNAKNENGNEKGYIYYTNITSSESGRIKQVNWSVLAETGNQGIISVVTPAPAGAYIGGSFSKLMINGTSYDCNNIGLYSNNAILPLSAGLDGPASSISVSLDSTVFVAGNFTFADDVVVNNIAKWDGNEWFALGSGILPSSLASHPHFHLNGYRPWQIETIGNDQLVVGGSFTQAGDIAVNNIAMWDDQMQQWQSLGNDTSFADYHMNPFTINISEEKLFVASQGHQAFLYNLKGSEEIPVGENIFVSYDLTFKLWGDYYYNEFLIEGVVFDMEFYDNDTILIGGIFRKIGNLINVNNMALLDYETLEWTSVEGISGVVTCFKIHQTNVFVGGYFESVSNDGTSSFNVAAWNPELGWTSLGSILFVGARQSTPAFVNTMVIYNDILYCGGNFRLILDGNLIQSLVGWNILTGNWVNVQQNLSGVVLDMKIHETILSAAGNFVVTQNNTTVYYNLASLDIESGEFISVWPAVCRADYNECESQWITSISIYPECNWNTLHTSTKASCIYIAGSIGNINGIVMNGISRLVNGNWASLGSGITSTSSNRANVQTINLTPDLVTLYVGGEFSQADSIPVLDIAAWSVEGQYFSGLPSLESWSMQSCIFDVLADIGYITEEVDQSDSVVNHYPFFAVVLISLTTACIILCLILIVVILLFVRHRSETREAYSAAESFAEKDCDWDDFYSNEWEISYNLLEILEPPIGKGYHGVIHRAAYKGQDVAVKIFKSQFSQEYYIKENICRYAAILRSFSHPNVCHMVGACADPLSLVTEYASFGSLSDVIRINPRKLNWSKIKSVALEAAKGMEYLHGQDPPFIHCNVTSHNILIDEYWSPKITDMGLCTILNESPFQTCFVAPEILEGGLPSQKTDVYSFSMVLYHMMTQSLPFSQEEWSIQELENAVCNGSRPDMRGNTSDHIPAPFIELVNQCWHADPTKRPHFSEITKKISFCAE